MNLLYRGAIFNLQEMTTARKAKKNPKQTASTVCPIAYHIVRALSILYSNIPPYSLSCCILHLA